MTAPHHPVISDIIAEVDVMTRQLSQISGRLHDLDRALVTGEPIPAAPPIPAPAAPYWQQGQPWWPTPPAPGPVGQLPEPTTQPVARRAPSTDSSWIGKLLAVAGVAVTLIGVALLLVLAAQAGLLRPEVRVIGGAALAASLVGVAIWWHGRPGGRTGAIAIAATGMATGYLDVLAVTTIYQWVPAAVGLVLAALVGAAGLFLSRRWDSEQLGSLIVIPLIVLAPVITDGVDLLLIGFMLTLSAAVLPVQMGKDWVWLHGARIAAPTLPLLLGLVTLTPGRDTVWLLIGACAIAAVLAIASGLLLLPSTANPAAVATLSAIGTLPVLGAAVAVDRIPAAAMAAALAAAMLAIVLLGVGLPVVAKRVFSALSAVSALIAVTVAFDGHIAGPMLLGLAIVVALAGGSETAARWAAIGFGMVGVVFFLCFAPPEQLATATVQSVPDGVSILVDSVLVIGWVLALGWALRRSGQVGSDGARVLAVMGGGLAIYAITAFTVTAGVLAFGTGGGFLGGHVAATLCWIAIAAALFMYALRIPDRENRAAPIWVGLALTAAAMAKLFLFDLGTLDGMFRVAVFIVAGLILLGMGAGYARSLAQQNRPPD